MEEEYRKIEWEKDDVIAFLGTEIKQAGLTVEKLNQSIRYDRWGQDLTNSFAQQIKINNNTIITGNNPQHHSKWFDEGIDCKIMRAYDTKGWRKGKIRVKLNIEFELWEERENESESPLDNFREN